QYQILVVITSANRGRYRLCSHFDKAIFIIADRSTVGQCARDGKRFGRAIVYKATVFKGNARDHSWDNCQRTRLKDDIIVIASRQVALRDGVSTYVFSRLTG